MENKEQKAVASQEQGASQEPAQEASNQVPITESPEFKRELARLAQSEADKRSKVFEEQIKTLKSQLRDFQSRSEEGEVESFLNRYVQNGELPETSVPPIRDFAKKVLDRDKEARKKEAEAAEALRKAEEKEKEVAELKATREIQRLAKGLNVSLSFDDAEVIAKKTQGNIDWATDLIQTRKPSEPEKEKPRRPDSSVPSAPGGKLTDIQLREQYASGKISIDVYERECRERGISPN